jgi:hypothetical protein
MTYTFWHCGVLIGESNLEESSDHPRQRGGIFWPTAHGLQVFPRLTGMLTAAHALKMHLDANGLSVDALPRREVEELFETTPAGQKVIDIGRMLSDVEVRAPDGKRVEFASIAFSDVLELRRLTREMSIEGADDLANLPDDAPRYMVSATFRHRLPAAAREEEQVAHFRRAH